jgi:uncharacterized protein YdeI (YjbR/CyaY-like superfamily)
MHLPNYLEPTATFIEKSRNGRILTIMATTDKRIDDYIKKSAPFAQPILKHIRALVHKACPEVAETVKWGFPHFEYKGILCSMASFKQHCSFGFWKATLMKDDKQLLKQVGDTNMGAFDRMASMDDLPSDKILTAYIKEAVRLNDEDIKLPPKPKSTAKELPIPPELSAALKKNKKAATAFEKFPPSHRKEYIMWIIEAKTDETRNKRVATTVEWVAEGKGRNWKYEKKQ